MGNKAFLGEVALGAGVTNISENAFKNEKEEHKMKKNISKLVPFLATVLAIALTYFLPVQGTLAHAEEADAGGTREEAKVIELGKTYSETIADGDDQDFFQFVTTERGYFQVTLAHNDADETSLGDGWNINVLNKDGEVLLSSSDIQESWTSVAMPYKKGTTFYIQVSSDNGWWGAVGCIYDLTVSQTVTEDWEVESNDTEVTATEIAVDSTYHGMLLNGIDTDYFQFTTTTHGCFQIQFAQNAADDLGVGDGWNVSVLNDKGETIISGKGIVKNWTSVTLPYAEAGRKFYVQVSSNNGNWGAVHCTYDLTVNQTPASDWENEPNETLSEANLIATNKTFHGMLINGQDTDCFQFTTSVGGYFQVQFAHNAADNSGVGDGWNVSVLNDKGETIISGKGIVKNWTSVTLPYAEAGRKFYVQVSPNNGNWGAVYCTYDLTVSQTKTSIWESEPNDTRKEATAIKAGKTYHGITGTSNDEDFYKLSVPASGKLKFRLSSHNANPLDSVGYGWDLVVYDKKSNWIAEKRGIKTEDSVTLEVKKGTYYVKITRSYSWAAPVGCRYTLLADYVKAPSAPKISAVKAEKKSALIKWKKVSGADGYYVYRSTSPKSGFQKVQTLKKASALSWKNKKLKSGRKYYYKVASYKKVKGMIAVSSYSAVKPVKVK